jgi:hypothetical protein
MNWIFEILRIGGKAASRILYISTLTHKSFANTTNAISFMVFLYSSNIID